MIPVSYNEDEPVLMAQFEEHWDKGVTVTRNKKVKARILREWKGGNCKILIPEEVHQCLTKTFSVK
jgi:hypothetical protein